MGRHLYNSTCLDCVGVTYLTSLGRNRRQGGHQLAEKYICCSREETRKYKMAVDVSSVRQKYKPKAYISLASTHTLILDAVSDDSIRQPPLCAPMDLQIKICRSEPDHPQ